MSQRHIIGTRTILVNQLGRVRFSHVVKHLYVPWERWDLAVPELPGDLRSNAREAGCKSRDLSMYWQWERVGERCREHVLGDHDRYYLPAALDAIQTADESGDHAVVETRQGLRELLVGANAVQVFLGIPAREQEHDFITALRNAPSRKNPTNKDFHKKAVRKLRDKASLGSGERP